MDDPLAMRVVDGVADLAGVVERAREVEGATRCDEVLERLAWDVLHHDEEHVILLLGRRDRHDVRVVEARQQAWLPEQLAEVEILPVGHLDRHLLVDPGVFREVDTPEAAAPERREDLVLPEDLSAKTA